jgi:hypothetical protein
MFMEANDHFYSSVTDATWFSGTPVTRETGSFTWAINSSLLSADAADWRMSFSEVAADYTNIHGSVEELRQTEDSRQVTASTAALHLL